MYGYRVREISLDIKGIQWLGANGIWELKGPFASDSKYYYYCMKYCR